MPRSAARQRRLHRSAAACMHAPYFLRFHALQCSGINGLAFASSSLAEGRFQSLAGFGANRVTIVMKNLLVVHYLGRSLERVTGIMSVMDPERTDFTQLIEMPFDFSESLNRQSSQQT
jgi:hypothetical protein